MRIGIITLPLHVNYGGIMQAYALQTVLTNMGHDVVLVNKDWRQVLTWWRFPISIGARLVRKYLLGRDLIVFEERKYNNDQIVRRQYTDAFIAENIKCKIIKNLSELRENDFDAIVVGSDQVWRPKYFQSLWHSDVSSAFLDFAMKWNIKRLAYAVSFGVEEWEYSEEQTARCKELIKRFNGVSVRESQGIGLCKKYLATDTVLALDPTLLLNEKDYESLYNKSRIDGKGKLVCYVLDDNPKVNSLIQEIAVDRGLELMNINNRNTSNRKIPAEKRIQPPVEDWLRGIATADFIVTDSFHCCIFSILFKRQFIVVGNQERGMNRFESLLGMTNLRERLLYDFGTYERLQQIDYRKVFMLIEKARKESMTFLKSGLK